MSLVNIIILLAIVQEIEGQIVSPCPKYFVFEPNKSEDDRWYGIISVSSVRDLKGITLDLEFDKSIIQLGNWLGAVKSDSANTKFTIKSNKEIKANTVYKAEIYAVYDPYYDLEPPRLIKIKLNGREICPHYEEEKIMQTIANNDNYRPLLELNINVPKCGIPIATPVALVTEGHRTQPGQFPWHAALYRKDGDTDTYVCGGTLIDEQHIVTAAHCATKQNFQHPRDPKELVVILGKYGLWVSGKFEQPFTVIKVSVHEDFNRTSFYNDIAILKLNKPTEYTSYVRPICLWEDNTSLDTVINKVGIAVGWGRDHKGHSTTDLLMQANMPVISTLDCIYSYPEFYSLYTNKVTNFCAGSANGMSVCLGDSGGGLIFPKSGTTGANTVWQLRGIVSNSVSRGDSCDPNKYVIFTDASKYLDWIAKTIKTP